MFDCVADLFGCDLLWASSGVVPGREGSVLVSSVGHNVGNLPCKGFDWACNKACTLMMNGLPTPAIFLVCYVEGCMTGCEKNTKGRCVWNDLHGWCPEGHIFHPEPFGALAGFGGSIGVLPNPKKVVEGGVSEVANGLVLLVVGGKASEENVVGY